MLRSIVKQMGAVVEADLVEVGRVLEVQEEGAVALGIMAVASLLLPGFFLEQYPSRRTVEPVELAVTVETARALPDPVAAEPVELAATVEQSTFSMASITRLGPILLPLGLAVRVALEARVGLEREL